VCATYDTFWDRRNAARDIRPPNLSEVEIDYDVVCDVSTLEHARVTRLDLPETFVY